MRVVKIPRHLLGDRVSVFTPADGEYGGTFSSDPVVIENVHVEPAEAIRTASDYVFTDGARALMFVDASSSINAFEIPVGSVVEWYGQRMTASVVTPLRVGGTVHHWEVQLS